MAVLQMLNGQVLYASLFNQNGPANVSDRAEIGGYLITAEQMKPEYFVQLPLETSYRPMVAAKNGGVEGCFKDIAQTCASTLTSERYICAGEPKSDTAFFGALKQLHDELENVYIKLNDLSIPLISHGRISSGIISTAEHISICADYLQTSWKETFVLFRGIDLSISGSKKADTLMASSASTSRMVVEVTPDRVQVSLIQVSGGKYQYVCMFSSEGGGQLEFSIVPNGKVGGREIQESQYNCGFFLNLQAEPVIVKEAAIKVNVVHDTIEKLLKEEGKVIESPTDCFNGIESSCAGQEATSKFVCADNSISDTLVTAALLDYGLADIQFLSIEAASVSNSIASGGASTYISHNAICANKTTDSWTEVYQVTTTRDKTAAGTTYGVAVIEQTPFYATISFLQMTVDSFGVSSVQYACYQVNGDVVTYQNLPASIGGFTVDEDQYDCSRFKTHTIQNGMTSLNATVSELSLVAKAYPDISDDVGLVVEVSLASIYILIAAFYTFRARKLHNAQRTHSSFKTNINAAFLAVFATGNLIYLVSYFFQTRESNFYVKQILTLTYFGTYLLFVMSVHYRYHASLTYI
jgi:hypothetical protein